MNVRNIFHGVLSQCNIDSFEERAKYQGDILHITSDITAAFPTSDNEAFVPKFKLRASAINQHRQCKG